MHRILVLAVVVAMAATAAFGQGGKVEQSLTQMEREWVEAAQKKDADTLGRILADDWVGQGPTGTTTKAQALAELKSGDNKIESITLGDMKVRVFGDTAVVAGSDDEKSSYKGKDTSGHYTWTDVFVKRQGKWQAAASQTTLVAP
jgi:ketosteroid isomerase-like protein